MDNILTHSSLILDSLNDGVYVCDKDRRIVYWSKSAEKITGWESNDVVGRRCLDDVLCHIDKDNHPLCGEEFCPLHRSMITGGHKHGAAHRVRQGEGWEADSDAGVGFANPQRRR